MSTILDDDNDLNYLNNNLNESDLGSNVIIEDEENNNSDLIHKKEGKKKDKVWQYFNILDISNNFHKGAEYIFCS